MTAAGIPKNVEQLVTSTIGSVEQLEVLLLLHGDASRDWSPEEVSAKLRTNPASSQRCLELLELAGLVSASDGRYRFSASPATTAVVRELARCYSTYRVRLIELIFGGTRDTTPQRFADAFRLRRPR